MNQQISLFPGEVMPKAGNPTIEKLQHEALGVGPGPAETLPNLAEAYEMFSDLLEEPHANASKIGKMSGINAVAIGALKTRKMEKISDDMFGKLKKLYDGVKAGRVVFEETKRGRKAGVPVAPKKKVATAPKTKKAKPAKLPAFFTDTALVTTEMITEKEEQMKSLALEIEFMKEMKKLQERFIGRG